MGFIHLLTYGFIIATVEGIADGKHAVFLAKHEMGTGIVFLADFGTHLFELFPSAVAQGFKLGFGVLGSNMFHHVFARVAAIVVGRARQFVLHATVDEHEAVAFGFEGEVFEVARTTVEAHQLAFLSEDAGKLIHDTAVHTHIFVLGGLSGKHHIPLGNLVVAEQIVQGKGKAALKCRT